MEDSPDPPFKKTYKSLIKNMNIDTLIPKHLLKVEECELPLIDLNQLNKGDSERENCKKEIAKASREWGFFQVMNHGISQEILEKMRLEQVKLLKKPFQEKANEEFLVGSYRWGTPSATCLKEVAWSEAFHVPISAISALEGPNTLRSTMEAFVREMSELAHKLADILAERIGIESTFFRETCLPNTCYLRMNRYPPCQISLQVFGLMPHTDSDFITVLHQDEIGGLQLLKDCKWFAVKPRPEVLIINVGDLLQAWSNGVYKSVEHRVVTNTQKERFSIAFFMCPSYDTVVKSSLEPSVYRTFSFKDYRDQVQEDVWKFGHKVGLSRFLV